MNSKNAPVVFTRSKELHQRASQLTPGGVHSNVRWRSPHPLFFSKAKGSRIWDADDNEYTDYLGNFGALILGHGDEDVTASVKRHLENGLTTGTETELNIVVAEKLIKMIPCAEMVRFCNSGTEANMHAIQLARGFTRRDRVLKTEGNYHGWYDYVYCSHRYPVEEWRTPQAVPASGGLAADVSRSTLVVPWNDFQQMERVIEQHKKEIAAVIMEPVDHNIGCALPRAGYLEQVRELTRRHGIVLIFDEVITGFRSAPGGAQEYLGVIPDLATFGKAIANGFPLSAVAGSREIFSVASPENQRVSFGGTYNANQIVVAAADVVLDKLKDGRVQAHLNRLTERLIQGFGSFARSEGVEARLQGFGGKFQVYFTDGEVLDWRTAVNVDRQRYALLQNEIMDRHILMVTSPYSHNGLTAAHTENDVDLLLQGLTSIIADQKRGKAAS